MKILLVEDNKDEAKAAIDVLKSAGKGVEITHVEKLSIAFKRLSREHFDAIVLDMELLDTHGLDPFEQILGSLARMPIVLLTTPDDEAMASKALQHGAQDYLIKGRWRSEQLKRSLEHAIKRKRAEQNLSYLAQYDYLTALANRSLFRDRLTHAMARSKRSSRKIALMRLGLDHFRDVNNTLGQEKGDVLLKMVAGRLTKCQRETDTVARLWGDEFTVLLEDFNSEWDVSMVAKRMITAIAKPFEVEGQSVTVTASMGITIYPLDKGTLDELLGHAGTAMEKAKEEGGNNFQFFIPVPLPEESEKPSEKSDKTEKK
jgi:two-component system, cell cycle response regulator